MRTKDIIVIGILLYLMSRGRSTSELVFHNPETGELVPIPGEPEEEPVQTDFS